MAIVVAAIGLGVLGGGLALANAAADGGARSAPAYPTAPVAAPESPGTPEGCSGSPASCF
ncbi:hypothetical protein [Kitasatospora sp. NPDC093806]|uniref:hypothetical protein n=1 Tax=Kitasatospora sp. NPDC093806 TaxID=3155075 RepID=UPI0034430D76